MRTSAPSKIRGPTSSGVLLRHRLFRFLAPSRHGPPLVWITGPPGSGKTTLVASWLDAPRIPYLWYDVDEGDSDPASFFYYLGLAAKRAAPRKRKPLPLLTPEFLLGIPTFSRHYFEELFTRMLSAAGNDSHSVIVFDNYQEVPEESRFHAILYEGLSRVPEEMKIVLISRKDPPEAFVRLRANSLMKIIGWDELKFTRDESKEMVDLRGHGQVSSNFCKQLYAKTDGWAAGIVLLLESARRSDIEPVLSGAYPPKEIFQYFAGEIFNRTAPETRDFLLKTSLLPRISSRVAEALTGNHHAPRILADLSARNYFTQKLESEIDIYQYHPLFRDFLQFAAKQTFSRDALRQIQKQAAMLLEQVGRTEYAVELLEKAEDWPNSVQLILKHAPDFAAQGRGQTIERWISALPQTTLATEPWLLYWQGICRLFCSPADSRLLFEKAFNLFRSRRDARGVFVSLSGLFDATIYSFDSFKPFDSTLALFDEVLREFPDFPSLEIEARWTANKLYAMVMRQPWHPDIKDTAERGFSMLPTVTDVGVKTQLLRALLFQPLFSGDIQKAGHLIDLFRDLVQTPKVSPLAKIAFKVHETFYFLLKAEFESAAKAAEEGLEMASSTGVRSMDTFLLGRRASVAIELGDPEAAAPFLDKMVDAQGQRSWGRELYHVFSAWKSYLRRDYADSLHHAETALKFSIEVGVPQTIAFSRLVYALALHKMKMHRQAMDHLAESHAAGRLGGFRIHEFACMLAEAKFAFDKGDDSTALATLRKALPLGRENGWLCTPWFCAPSIMAELCQRALEAGIEVDYVRRLIRKRSLMPAPPPVDCKLWPWALKIYTLGQFEIVRHDEALQFSGKVQKKPLQLLKILISSGGSEVSEELIADRLWPDAPGDVAHNSFTTALSRLRRLLGVEKSITVQEGKTSFDPRCCWVDASAFEQILARLDKSIAAGESSQVLALAENALALYQGHFLPADEAESWSISYRERLRSRFSRLIIRVGNLLENAGQWDKAIEYYQKGLDIEDVSEEFYQRLMICYRQLGLYANAIDVYRRCKKLLSTKLGIEPSAETKAIYEKVANFRSDI